MQNDTTQFDPSVVALMHGLKTAEGAQGDYNKMGDLNTAAGIGQWSNQFNGKAMPLQHGEIPNNFKGDAQQYGLDPNDFSPENQNRVMYTRLAAEKAKGLSPEQILSKWNSGDPNKYLTQPTGIGQVGKYDVKSYVSRAMSAAQQYTQGYKTKPELPPPAPTPDTTQPEGLAQELAGRAKQAAGALSGMATSEISPISGALQTLGSVGGAVGDVTGATLGLANKALRFIPGVSSAEDFIGSKVGEMASGIANTDVGKSVISGAQDFSKQHPELSADINALWNIGTAVPMLKGAGLATGLVKRGVGEAATGAGAIWNKIAPEMSDAKIASTQAQMKGNLMDVLQGSKGGYNLADDPVVARNIDTMVKEGIVPGLSPDGTRFDATTAGKYLDSSLSTMGNAKQVFLAQDTTPIALKSIKQAAIDDVMNNSFLASTPQFQANVAKAVGEQFDTWEKGVYGKNVTLAQTDSIQNDVAQNIKKWTGQQDDVNTKANKQIYHTIKELQNAKDSSGTLAKVNDKMTQYLNIQKILFGTGKKGIGGLHGASIPKTADKSFIKKVASSLTGRALGTLTGSFLGGAGGAIAGGEIEQAAARALKTKPGFGTRKFERVTKTLQKRGGEETKKLAGGFAPPSPPPVPLIPLAGKSVAGVIKARRKQTGL